MTSSYQTSAQDQVVRTNMEVGTARARLRSTAKIDHVSLQWLFTDAEMATFKTWFYGDGAAGASWFAINLAVGQTGLTTVTARFLAPYNAQPMPNLLWQVQAQLEVRYA